MKRAAEPRPAWIKVCPIKHASGSVIDFPMVNDLASLLWVVNLGCIDLNPRYARCDDVDRAGSRGIHIYCVPIVRGPTQKQVWSFAKELARILADRYPQLITAEYRVAKRPSQHVLVDYNQNVWGRTLASVYSVRPTPLATVSTPVTWEEISRGIRIEDFRLDNVPCRVQRIGDLWRPLLRQRGRFNLEKLLAIKS